MNRAERRRQKKEKKPQDDRTRAIVPKQLPGARKTRIEKGLIHRVSQQRGRGS